MIPWQVSERSLAARFHGPTADCAKHAIRCQPMTIPTTLVIAGALAQKPKIAGHTWVLLQYLLGFRRLGFRTLFIDYLEPSLCVDERGWKCALEGSDNLRYVLDVVRAFGLEEDYVLIGPGGESLDRHASVTAPRARGTLGLRC